MKTSVCLFEKQMYLFKCGTGDFFSKWWNKPRSCRNSTLEKKKSHSVRVVTKKDEAREQQKLKVVQKKREPLK